nr:DUF2975 domain-containing protein [uncultured Marinifilum sp.]
MKKGIINSLSWIFRSMYSLSILAFAAIVIGAIISPFTYASTDSEIINFNLSTHLDLPISYTIWNDGEFSNTASLNVNQLSLSVNSIWYRIFGNINSLLTYGCMALVFKLLSDIFKSLSRSVKQVQFFEIDNYYKIKRIGFISLGYHIYGLIKSLCVAWLFIDELSIDGQTVSYSPEFSDISHLFPILIIFVIAEVYKAGIQLKEESELTI